MIVITVSGRLGADPEMRYMPSGDPVTSFRIASGRKYTNKETGKEVKNTAWIRVSVFGRQAETCNQWLKSGRFVVVTGDLVFDPETGGPRIYNRSDGTPGASFEVRALNVEFGPQTDGSAPEDE